MSGLVADLDTRIEIRRVLQNISNKYLSIGKEDVARYFVDVGERDYVIRNSLNICALV